MHLMIFTDAALNILHTISHSDHINHLPSESTFRERTKYTGFQFGPPRSAISTSPFLVAISVDATAATLAVTGNVHADATNYADPRPFIEGRRNSHCANATAIGRRRRSRRWKQRRMNATTYTMRKTIAIEVTVDFNLWKDRVNRLRKIHAAFPIIKRVFHCRYRLKESIQDFSIFISRDW